MKLFLKVCFMIVFVGSMCYPVFSQEQDARGIIESLFKKRDDDKETKTLSKAERDAAKQRFVRDMALVYDYVYKNYYKEPKSSQMLEGAISGMMKNLGDPYSTFITAEKAKEYSENISGKFGGVGIRIDLGTDDESGITYVKVVSPIKNTPAQRMGIRTGDFIIGVGETSLAETDLRDAVKLMRGEPGTQVKLTIKRDRSIFNVIITRAIINDVNLAYDYIDKNIAYLSINSFSQDLPKDFNDAITELNKKKYKTLIVDLRGNPGGSLQAVIEISDAFLQGQLIVGTKARDSKVNKEYSAHKAVLVDPSVEVVVLINEGSASASEIFSGAIKDNERGVIVGSNTFGKGLVQAVSGFESGFISLTVSQYYTPDGHFINGKGIKPDVEIKIEEKLSAQDEFNLRTIVQDSLTRKFVEKNKSKSLKELLPLFKQHLVGKGIKFPHDSTLRRLLYYAYNSTNNTIRVFSLENDEVLRRTVAMIRNGTI